MPPTIIALHLPWLNLCRRFLLGGLCAAAVGMLFGLPSLRIKGYYLAVATLAAQFFLDWMFIRIPWFTNYCAVGVGQRAAARACSPPVRQPAQAAICSACASCLSRLLAKNLVRGRIGRDVDGDPRHGHRRRDHRHPAAARQAVGLRRELVLVGVAGALWAFVHLGSWEPLAFSIDRRSSCCS